MVTSWGVKAQRFENLAPADFDALVMRQQFAKLTAQPPTLLIVRGYQNWLASASALAWRRITHDPHETERERDAKDAIRREYLGKLIDSWVDLFRESVGETHYLTDCATVRYEWFRAGRGYRETLCRHLGGEYTEDLINHVPVNGGGSSFDGMQMMHRGSAMTTDRRRMEVLNHPAADLFAWALETRAEVLDLWMVHTGEEKEM